MSNQVLILGAAGFIGSHLCDRLLDSGYRVLGVDNLLTGRKNNLEHLMSHEAFKFFEADICKPLELAGPIDWIFDLASPASPVDYLRFPLETLHVGSVGVENLLRLAKAKQARFLLASTSEVYGDPLITPQHENYWGNVNPIGPRSVYDESKRYAEAITMAYCRHEGVKTRIARIFNTYGPRMRMDDGRVVSTFMTQTLRGEALTIYGEGKQTRSFCYIDDTVEALIRLIASDTNQPINIGNPHELSVLELAIEIQKIAGSSCPITFLPLPEDDPRTRNPDISRARELLGWTPRVSFADGMRRTFVWFAKSVSSYPRPML